VQQSGEELPHLPSQHRDQAEGVRVVATALLVLIFLSFSSLFCTFLPEFFFRQME
jgi:hypothetical protein